MSLPLADKLQHYLCPPGNGVFTVNTAKERKQQLHQAIYGQTENIDAVWRQSLTNLEQQSVAMLGVCSDTGGGILRGANWGPLFLRTTLAQHYPTLQPFDLGDIRVIPHLLHDKYLNQATQQNCRKALYQDEQTERQVAPLSMTEDLLASLYQQHPQLKVFGIGGDHSVSYALTKPYLQAKQVQGKKVAIIHFDAHTDLLVERLGIDLCFGSWCTHILEYLAKPSHLVQIGIRSSGKPKAHWQDTFGVVQYWAHEVIDRGADAIVDEIIANLSADGIEELYISYDIDALDASIAAATGTPEPDGLDLAQSVTIINKLLGRFSLTGADMMEISPFINTQESTKNSAQQTTLEAGAALSALMIKAMQDG